MKIYKSFTFFHRFKLILAFSFFTSFAKSSVIIQCDFRTAAWTIGNQYTCFSTVEVEDNGAEVIAVVGDHQNGRTNEDVKMLVADDQFVLTQFPRGVGNFFPDLLGISAFGGNIETITSDDLEPFPNLQLLNLRMQKLVTLEGDLLQNNLQLQWINFSDNLLEGVENGLLNGLNNLSIAFFNRNPCASLQAASREEMQNLQSQLSRDCPFYQLSPTTTFSSTTPDSQECSPGCADKIKALEIEFTAETNNLNRKIDAYEQRLTELEKQLREISSNPRSQAF